MIPVKYFNNVSQLEIIYPAKKGKSSWVLKEQSFRSKLEALMKVTQLARIMKYIVNFKLYSSAIQNSK